MTCEPDPATAIALLRAQGAERFDPVRLHFLEALAKRTQGHQGAVKCLLEDKLNHALAHFHERLARVGDAANALQRPEPGAPPSALAELTRTLTQQGSNHAQASTAASEAGVDGMDFRPELKSIRHFRDTWSRLSVDKQLAQAMEQGPENAGPFNSHQLVLRALTVMRDVSPHYLSRFMSYADALLWLDQADGKPAAKSTADGEGEKKRKTSPIRAR